jgi:hypothetical protein
MQLEYTTKTRAPQQNTNQKKKIGKEKNRVSDWNTARAYLNYYLNHYPIEQAAARYFEAYPKHPLDKLEDRKAKRKKLAKKALLPGGWADRLLTALNPNAYFYTLSMANLKLPATYADSSFMYIELVIKNIKDAIAKLIPRPYYFKIESGKNNTLHVHVIGPFSPQLSHLMGSERAKTISPDNEFARVKYVLKPVAAYTEHNLKTYLQAKADLQTKNLPTLSGYRRLPQKNKSAEKEKDYQ